MADDNDDTQSVAMNEERLNYANNLEEELLAEQSNDYSREEEDGLRIMNKSISRLRKEEEDLIEQLELHKKENFSLQASIDSLQSTLQKKLDNLKNAETQLDEIYQGIWDERENFCDKADEINEEFGTMSEWWKTQLEFVSDLENLREKRASNKNSQKEIEICQDNLREINRKINALLEEKRESEVLEDSHESGDSATEIMEYTFDEPVRSETKLRIFKPFKKLRLSDGDDESLNGIEETDEFVNDKFFEMMDVDKVRMVNRRQSMKEMK